MSASIRVENGLPTIDDLDDVPRRLGCLVPPLRTSIFPEFEVGFPLMSEAEILAVAKDGSADGRKKFDESYIDDQKSHGACNGFAEALAETRARVRRGLERVMLSGAYAYSLMNGGQDNGSNLENGFRNVAARGIATRDTVKWNQIYPHLYDKAKADAEAANYKGFEPYAVTTLQGLFTAAALNFDIVVAVDVDDSFMRLDANGFPGSGRGMGNHAVGVDGLTYAGGKLALTGYNSWNLSYGDRGRMLLSEQHFVRTFNAHLFYAIRSTNDGGA